MIRGAVLLLAVSTACASETGRTAEMKRPDWTQKLAAVPMSFEAHGGSRFLARGRGYAISISSDGVTMDLRASHLKWSFKGSTKRAVLRGCEKLPGTVNYFLGNDPKRWRTNIPTYAKVRIDEVYPGIDLVYYGNQRQLEYDLIVASGADPDLIQLAFEGATRIERDSAGGLLLHTAAGPLTFRKPVIYQVAKDGARREIAGGYVLHESGLAGFHIGEYDRERPLVVNPVLVYSAYFSGSGLLDESMAVAVDGAGNAYVTGQTYSTNFPVVDPIQPRPGEPGPVDAKDAFVLKMNASGSALVYSTYLGGTARDFGLAIATDSSGAAYVTGYTASTNFPTTTAVQGRNSGGTDAFVAKLNSDGNALVYSTYLGGADFDSGQGIAVDSSGQAYVAGITYSAAFPVVNALQRARAGSSDAFIAKINAAGTALIYSTYLGGSGNNGATSIATDAVGAAYVAGATTSATFPNVGAAQANAGGRTDAFVAKLNPSGSALVYSTYLGGGLDDGATGIAIDSSGAAYVTGLTSSANFPAPTPLLPAGGGRDVFVTKLNPAGSSLVYSTFLGGAGDETSAAMAVDSAGNAIVAGQTSSFDFPVANELQPAMGGSLMWKSSDGGRRWAPAAEGLKAASVNCLMVDPKTPSTAYAGTTQGVFKTTDGGTEWAPMTKGLTSSMILQMTAGDVGTIYAATTSGVFRGSVSTGEWTPTGLTFAASFVAADSRQPSTLYAGTGNAVQKSTDGGKNWSTVLSRNNVLSFSIDPGAPSTLYAVAAGSIFRSVNAGADWTPIAPPRPITVGEVWTVTTDPKNSDTLYFAGSLGIYKSTNGGAEWTPATNGLTTARVTTFVIDADSQTIYAGTYSGSGAFGPGGIYRSADGGATWIALTLEAQSVSALAVSSGTMYAGAIRGADAFMTKLNANGTALLHSTYFGGQDSEGAFGVAVDSAGNAYLAGSTSSLDLPMVGPIFARKGSMTDGFLAKISDTPLTLPPLYSISAASLSRSGSLAPDSMASAFGSGLASVSQSATALPLPTDIAGTSVLVNDSTGVERLAPLIAVSPGQVNYIVPEGTALGVASVSVTNGGRVAARGMVNIEAVAPALFAANADGRGVPAAIAVSVAADGTQRFVPVFQCGETPGSCEPAVIDLSAGPVVLSLFGTGIRGRTALSAVTALIYSARAVSNLRPLYAGAQSEYPALDQLNVELPRNLINRGECEIQIMVGGIFSNRLRMVIR